MGIMDLIDSIPLINQITRIVIVLGCFWLVGVNFGFVVNAKWLFSRETYWMWRIFFLGKSTMTLYAGASIWTRVASHEPLSWRAPMVALGLILTNIALFKLYVGRAFVHASGETAHNEDIRDIEEANGN
jgi:hypothetical protein